MGGYILVGAFENLGINPLSFAVLLFGVLCIAVGVYISLSRHKVVLDRNRKKVIYQWKMLLWSLKEREYDWKQCAAVEVGELLPYMNTLKGRRPLLLLRGSDAGFQEPNVGKEGTTYFSVGIACGDEVIPLEEFSFVSDARRLARKVARFMELPIQDRAR